MSEFLPCLKGRRRVLLFLDYDGTLTPVRKTPELAVLSSSRRRLLERLNLNILVCIVSGRSLGDVRRLVSIRNIAYIGNHGLEMTYRNLRWTHPEAVRTRPVLRDALARIRQMTKPWPGLLVEDKGLTGSVHYRSLAAPLPGELRGLVEGEVLSRGGALKLTEGKKVFEIRPSMAWDKGKGVREFIRRLDIRGPVLRIYIGDDQTDEDAFRALTPGDITIRVGGRHDSLARHRLPNVAAVWKFLDDLVRMTTPPRPGSPRRGRSA